MFQLVSPLSPRGDQPKAIEALSQGIIAGKKSQVLLGITGSGKTFTMAHVIEKIKKPTLILAHNKTLAAQLYQEFKALFPNNAVEYFVSYYDYYQPEAYVPRTDTYIEKDLAINDRIDRMRLSATRSLLERSDVIIVASVSCIYGLGLPEYFASMRITISVGDEIRRDDLLAKLVELHYTRNDYDLSRGSFRVRGDIIELVPAYEEDIAYRMEFFGDEIERISEVDPLTARVIKRMSAVTIYPGSHHVTPEDVREEAIIRIESELADRIAFFETHQRYVEMQRIKERTKYDLEMIKEMGFCKGVENYSRHFSKREAGQPPSCLLNYFPSDFLLIIDESHQTLPQIHAMYNGDKARKTSLIEYGFRLPSAYDNRPLQFEEFYKIIDQVVYVSATPGAWEIEQSEGEIVEQIIRPTGLLDPQIEVRPAQFQVDDCLDEIRKESSLGNRILVTTLTKKLAEELSSYLVDIGVKAKYLHSDIDTLERIEIIAALRKGEFDVLVGINLLREGLDIPEVSLVVILDADKEGFLRSSTALIQTCGRAARNEKGRVIMYADTITKSMESTISITQTRRAVQEQYNTLHNITPKTVRGAVIQTLDETFGGTATMVSKKKKGPTSAAEIAKQIKEVEAAMKTAAKELRFEEAAAFRDTLHMLQKLQLIEDNPL